MTAGIKAGPAIAAIGDRAMRRIAEQALEERRLICADYRDLPGKLYGNGVTWRAWAFPNPRAVKFDRLILVAWSRYWTRQDDSDCQEIRAAVHPTQTVTGWPGAPLDLLPAIDLDTGRWASLWRVMWIDGTFDIIAAHSRVMAQLVASRRVGGRHTYGDGPVDRPGVERIEKVKS